MKPHQFWTGYGDFKKYETPSDQHNKIAVLSIKLTLMLICYPCMYKFSYAAKSV